LIGAAELQEKAKERYDTFMKNRNEVMIAGSDDFTLSLWHPAEDSKQKSNLCSFV
jgi:hypothetical protein